MTAAAIGWIGEPGHAGQWNSPDALAIPLDERGLLLADGLFETVLVEQGSPQLLAAHISRWHHSAALLGLATPPSPEQIELLVQDAQQRSGITTGALRLNWSRGSGGRGIDLPADGGTPRFWLQLSTTSPSFEPVAVIVSPTERRCATSLLSRCKTFAYGPSIQARRQARAAGADDALLKSTAGGLCSGTTANLLLEIEGRWLTPPVSSGCLPGVMRQRALDLGLIEEAASPMAPASIEQGGIAAAWLLNSLGCRPIRSIHSTRLAGCDPEAAEQFWRRLLCTP